MPGLQLLIGQALGSVSLIGFVCLSLAALVAAEDVVITSSVSDPAARVRRTGQILEYTGDSLKLRTPLGRDEVIPAGQIIEVQTTWTEPHLAGRAAREKGELDEAIEAFREAKLLERRPWAIRQIMAELCGTYLEAERIESAGDEFLAIVANEPATMHYAVMPIAWRPAPPSASLERRASEWLAKGQPPVARVLGASWLLGGPQRTPATAALEELTKSTDERIASLAAIQLWRTKLVSAKAAEVIAWQSRLEKMQPEVQAAGWYVLGDLYSRLDQPQQAALAYLKAPVLFRRQRAIAADALLAAGAQLGKMGRNEQAQGLYREIVRDFGHLPAADQAKGRLK
jgi:tetratricopeptide (TPR) repeat protein